MRWCWQQACPGPCTLLLVPPVQGAGPGCQCGAATWSWCQMSEKGAVSGSGQSLGVSVSGTAASRPHPTSRLLLLAISAARCHLRVSPSLLCFCIASPSSPVSEDTASSLSNLVSYALHSDPTIPLCPPNAFFLQFPSLSFTGSNPSP